MSGRADSPTPDWMRPLVGRTGLVLAGLWGFAEGTLFFVVPDVLFTLVAAYRPRRALAHLASTTVGALLAGSLMFAWSARDPHAARSAVAAVPKVGMPMIEETETLLRESGSTAMFVQPLGGVPYKVYAVLAPARFSLPWFLIASVPARLERFALSFAAFAILGLALARRRATHPRLVPAIHAGAWCAIYGFYWFVR